MPPLFDAEKFRRISSDDPTDDAPARVTALDTTRSFLVEASAGSGKTELLIQRYLKLLAQVDEPEEILAITFTRKAAAEMRDRILQELRSAEKDDADAECSPHQLQTRALALTALENGRRRSWNLTRQPQRMYLRTIDSFCRDITARLPILTQMEAGAEPVTDAAELYTAASRSVLMQLGGADKNLNHAIRTQLLHLDNRFENAVQLLAGLLGTRDQWGHVLPIDREISDEEFDQTLCDQFEHPLQEIHASASREMKQALDRSTAVQIFSLIQHAANFLDKENKKNPFAACLAWTDIPSYRAEDATCWSTVAAFLLNADGDFRRRVDINLGFPTDSPRKRGMQELLASIADQDDLLHALRTIQALPPMQYTEQQRRVLRASFLLLRYALAHLKLTFAHTAKTDFTELLLAAQHALANDTQNIALALGTKIQHLLVDEMQDTSVTQFHLLSHLVKSWDGCSQTVFLVGDPKQSIYSFRHAEVALFARARQTVLGEVPLETISLTRNFRSQQSLVESTNAYFSQIFATTNDTSEILFQPSLSVHNEAFEERVHWHPQVLSKKSFPEEDSASDVSVEIDPALVEAETLCDVIEGYRIEDRTNHRITRIAILVSNKRHAWPILKAMQRRSLAYRAIEMDTLTDRQPLLDLLAISRCLLHAADRTAWLAVLRAPWCGLTLADLHTLCGSENAQEMKDWTLPELLRERIPLLSKDGSARAQHVWKTLEQACLQLPQERLASLVERTWHTLGGPSCIPTTEWPAVEQFFKMLSALEKEGNTLTATLIEERMQKLYAPTPVQGEDCVEVLTIHKAKGLEWDVVLLPCLHKKPRHDDPKLLLWSEEIRTTQEDCGDPDVSLHSRIFLAPIQHASETKEPIGQWIRKRIAQRKEAELKRLFYVACTRARRELHLFATAVKNIKGELAQPDPRSMLSVAWPFAKEIFTQAVILPNAADNLLTMLPSQPAPLPGIATRLAAETERSDASVGIEIPLSNFCRLPSGWASTPPLPDVWSKAASRNIETVDEEEIRTEKRPDASWKARLFGTVLHALMQPLAEILRTNSGKEDIDAAIQRLRQPATLRMMQGGYTPRDAQTAADRMVRVLLEVSTDSVAQWLLAKHPTIDPLLPEFEIPLTAVLHSTVRSVRLDRMFLAGAEPLSKSEGKQQLWIVDFKTATHGERNLEAFLAEQKEYYLEQMQRYTAVIQAAYPHIATVHVGLYFPLLQKFLWWAEGTS